MKFSVFSFQFSATRCPLSATPTHHSSLITRHISKAFTLLELLVAIAVMTLLLVLLLNMVDSASSLWRKTENRADSYREARAAIGIMSRDLQNALSSPTNANQFLINADAYPLLSSVGAGLVQDANTGGAVLFLSALPSKAQETNKNKSDVCEIGYFLALGKSSAVSNAPINTMNLYRYILSSDDTFARMTDNSQPLFPNNLSLSDKEVELLARNITAFSIRAYTSTNTNSPRALRVK